MSLLPDEAEHLRVGLIDDLDRYISFLHWRKGEHAVVGLDTGTTDYRIRDLESARRALEYDAP